MDSSNDNNNPPRPNLADIVEQRMRSTPDRIPAAQGRKEHEIRMKFRRLLDPGIVRPNNWDVALQAMKILDTLAGNILKEPENEKYLRFKATNTKIQTSLIAPKGALEYAVEMGFRAEVENFQPYYVFNPYRMTELRIGKEVIYEALAREEQKAERAKRAKEAEKAAKEEAAKRVMLAFEDDRKTKQERDAREKALRGLRGSAPPAPLPQEVEIEFDTSEADGGRTLSGPSLNTPPTNIDSSGSGEDT